VLINKVKTMEELEIAVLLAEYELDDTLPALKLCKR
jgi:hypothetical protein